MNETPSHGRLLACSHGCFLACSHGCDRRHLAEPVSSRIPPRRGPGRWRNRRSDARRLRTWRGALLDLPADGPCRGRKSDTVGGRHGRAESRPGPFGCTVRGARGGPRCQCRRGGQAVPGRRGRHAAASATSRSQPRIDGDTKVFELTIDQIEHRIDALKDPVDALGYNGVWPGPLLSVVEGDQVRAIFKNNLAESTGVHFHGQRLPNAMDGVPHVTQEPIQPGATFTYEFIARTPGSHMYHSHHNATDQVGRGLLGAFIVQPRDPAQRYDRLYGASQDIIWISNDTLGGFTINGRGFPATAPIVARLGDTIAIRFMNEGVMMHPWHVHGMPMRVVARDGYPLGSAAFTCDTLGVNPGERWDVVIECDEPGAWAFHCHILPHAEGPDGMFGMVTALIVQDAAAAISLASAGAPAYSCVVPSLG